MKDFLLSGAPLRKGNSWVLLLLRIFVSCMMLFHGFSKLANFTTLSVSFPDPLGVGPGVSLICSVLAETGCSLLLLFGIFTRLALLPLIFNMIVAIWVVHGPDPFAVKELGMMYLAIYVVFFFIGGGRYAFDYWFFRRKKSEG